MDANTELDFEDPARALGNPVGVPGHSNALRTFLRERPLLRSVWAAHYDGAAPGERPVSVWKMRGAASSQPTKIGEDDYQLIDHVFYDGKDLFDAGHLALHLREHKTGAYGEDRAAGTLDRRDWLGLLPNEIVPSDHLPIVWDFRLRRAPRLCLPGLLDAAAALLAGSPRSKLAAPDLDDGGAAWLAALRGDAARVLEGGASFEAELGGGARAPRRDAAALRNDAADAGLFLAGALFADRDHAPTHQETLLLAALRCAYAAVDGLGGDGAGGGVSSRAALAVAGHASELLLGPSPASVVYEKLDGAGAATLDDRELDALLGAAEREIADVADCVETKSSTRLQCERIRMF